MRVAVDVTPLLGRVTGVGQSVQGLLGALPAAAPDVEVAEWELTRRARSVPPAALVRLWQRFDRPSGDGWLPDADVVHGTNFVVPPTTRPSTVTVHDCWCQRSRSCSGPIAAATASVRRAVRRGAWLHVTTEWGENEVREVYGAERVRVVPFGVPPVPDAGPSPVDGPYVLALGSGPRKGIDTLRAAMGSLPDLQLVVTGEPPTRWVSDDTRAALLRGAAVLAYPSTYEGFGFPVLEAMSVGVPAVASAVGGVPEVAGDAAVLVPPGDVDALAAGIRRALDERDALVAAGLGRAATFTWSAHAAGMADLWREAAQ
jgi:glycosyltransferase involved in cell wall biosynthesis